MAGRMARLRFRYRPNKPGRAAAYVVVLIGMVVWILSGTASQPPTADQGGEIPFWTLVLAGGTYALVSFLDKFTFDPPD